MGRSNRGQVRDSEFRLQVFVEPGLGFVSFVNPVYFVKQFGYSFFDESEIKHHIVHCNVSIVAEQKEDRRIVTVDGAKQCVYPGQKLVDDVTALKQDPNFKHLIFMIKMEMIFGRVRTSAKFCSA